MTLDAQVDAEVTIVVPRHSAQVVVVEGSAVKVQLRCVPCEGLAGEAVSVGGGGGAVSSWYEPAAGLPTLPAASREVAVIVYTASGWPERSTVYVGYVISGA